MTNPNPYPGFDGNPQNQPPQFHPPNQNLQGAPSPNLGPQAAPAQQKARKPLWKRWWVWVIAVLLIAVAAFMAFVVVPAWEIADNIDKGVDMCKEQVTDRAKYPGGVEFVKINVPEASNGFGQEYVMPVTGEVDFPNGFGTPVRKNFFCLVTADENGANASNVGVF